MATTDSEPVLIRRLVDGDDGESHFVEGVVEMTARDVAPPAAPLDVSAPEAASSTMFFRAFPGWDGQQHPTPVRQWAFCLQGSMEVEASDGEVLHMKPGDSLLLEDVSSRGHTTRIVGDEPAVGLFVRVLD